MQDNYQPTAFGPKSGGCGGENQRRPARRNCLEGTGCHPEGDLRSSWKVQVANTGQGSVPIERPDLG